MLVTTSKNVDRQLQAKVKQLGESVAAGTDLAQAIDNDASLPDVFKSIVQAGTRSGKLAAAVESLNDTAKRTVDIHRKISEAMIYPAIVLALIVVLSVLVLRNLPDAFDEVVQVQGVERTVWIDGSIWALRNTVEWIWLPGTSLVAAMGAWVIASQKAFAHQAGWWQTVARFVPWVGKLLQLGRLATFTDLMALFVEHGVPLQESLPLAAKVSGDKVMLAECTQLADAITAGQSTTIEVGRRTAIPNLIRWQFASGMNEDELVRSLRASSQVYRYQADQLADRCGVRLPVYFTLCIGGTATVIYALAVMVPWFGLLKQLSF